jgi:arsenate reductase (thioredoxin)
VEETCPASLVPTEDWGIEDPEGKPVEEVRQIRDDIRNRVATLIKEE